MACFPHFFRHRNKNSFNPREDENSDPIVNNSDNPVQIGRYIRREEKTLFTPIITPSASEIQLQKQLSQTSVPTTPIATTRTIATTPTTATTSPISQIKDITSSSLTTSSTKLVHNNSLPKRFKSNRDKTLTNDKNNNSNNNSNYINSNNNGNNVKVVNSNGVEVTRSNSKLKPVKERRPTALPTEVPHIEDEAFQVESADQVDANTQARARAKAKLELRLIVDGLKSDALIDQNGASNTATPTPTLTPTDPNRENVKFFIGNGQNDVDSTTSDVHSVQSSLRLLVPSPSTPTKLLANGHLKSTSSASLNYITAQKSPTPHDSVNKPRWQRTGTDVDLSIPPPPPMPTELLVPSTPVHIRKKKSAESGRQKIAQASTEQKTGTSHRNSNTSNEIKSSHARNSNSAINADPAKFTLIELLNIDDDSGCNLQQSPYALSTSIQSNSTVGSCASSPSHTVSTLANCHSVSSDSGVHSEDQISSPKESESSSKDVLPKTQRIEGGLIFARPNLPEKTQIEIPSIEKDEPTRKLIHTAIERNDFLNNLMDKERKEMVINAMAQANYDKNSYIILEKEEGSEIFVSAEGYYDVIKDGKHVGNFGPATVFGELAILYNAPRQATIKAATNARVWKISRETFRAIMQVSGSREREENLNFLRSAPFLQELGANLLSKVVDLLQRKFYETNSCIVREGEVGNQFFIIRGGTVTIKKKNEDGTEIIVNKRKRGDYFGEQALLNADRRQASVYADAPGTEVLMLDREAFISYLGTIPQLREKPGDDQSDHGRSSNKSAEFDNEHANIAISDLKKVATLGTGAFGRVDLVTHGQKTYALKIMKKFEIVKSDQIEHVYNEKNVMMKCRNSPFIVELYRTYRNEKYLYFLMEVCMGGDVWTAMFRRQHFEDRTAKFIAACVVEAFDFLHSRNFVYRDLKPENLMLTTDGYCKLADFGFAKHVLTNDKTNTFAGTPEYVAPEIILDRGHDRAVDYWALGILIYELLVGKTPFRDLNQVRIYQRILSGIDVIHMPTRISRSAQGLIKHLCKQLPAERLGYQRRGIQDIKRHNWFDGIDWSKLRQKQLQSPLKRPINHPTDLQYFSPTGIENDYDPPDDTSGWDKDF